MAEPLEFVKKHWVWFAAGGGVLIAVFYMSSGSSSTGASGCPDGTTDCLGGLSPEDLSAEEAYSAQQAQTALAAQTEADQAAVAQEQAQAQTISASGAYIESEGVAAQDVGNAYASTIAAQAALPAAAIQAGEAVTATALSTAGGVVASGVNSVANSVGMFGGDVSSINAGAGQVIGNVAQSSTQSGNPVEAGALGISSILKPATVLGNMF